MSRGKKVARSITAAIQQDASRERPIAAARLKAMLGAFFALYHLKLGSSRMSYSKSYDRCGRSRRRTTFEVFGMKMNWTRLTTWVILDQSVTLMLCSACTGYRLQTFFASRDGKYLAKSVSRRFENSFFRDDLLEQYAYHLLNHLDSLIVRITDFLRWQYVSIGGITGLAPTHHIVMENLLTGRSQALNGDKWETWDLKPTSYFFPERDLASGMLASETTKLKLADKFDDKLRLLRADADAFMAQLEADTKLLEESNAVDYSLFLIRIPVDIPQDPFTDDASHDNTPTAPHDPPHAPPAPPTWQTGIRSADGKYVFRAAILDFFWAKHKAHPKFMTFLVKAWNIVDKKGPMSITTTPQDYRDRFLTMCSEMIEVDPRMEDCDIEDIGLEDSD